MAHAVRSFHPLDPPVAVLDLSLRLYREITGIQYGEIEDRHRGIQRVE